MKNSTRAWLFLSLLSVVLISLGHLTAGREGLLWGFTLSITINSFAYFYIDYTLTKKLRTQKLEGHDSWKVLPITRKMAQAARIPTPEVHVFHCDTPQALTVGRNWQSGKIILTDSIIRILSEDELRAIIAYQIACIKNFDTLALTIGSTLASAIMYIPQQLDRFLALVLNPSWEFQKKGQFVAWLVAPIASLIMVSCFRSSSLLEIDKQAAQLSGDKDALARAFWKVESYQKTKPFNFPATLSTLFIINPLTGQSWTRYFRIQPKTSHRIKNIIGYYPI